MMLRFVIAAAVISGAVTFTAAEAAAEKVFRRANDLS